MDRVAEHQQIGDREQIAAPARIGGTVRSTVVSIGVGFAAMAGCALAVATLTSAVNLVASLL